MRAARGGAQKLLDWQHVMYARLLHTSNVPTHIMHRRFNFKDDKDTKDKATSLSRALNAQRKGVIDKRGHDFMHNVTLVSDFSIVCAHVPQLAMRLYVLL